MKKISDVLEGVFADADVLRAARAQTVMRNWESVVGEIRAKHRSTDKFDRGTLGIYTSGAAWGQELRLRQDMILARLNELADEPELFTALRVTTRQTPRE